MVRPVRQRYEIKTPVKTRGPCIDGIDDYGNSADLNGQKPLTGGIYLPTCFLYRLAALRKRAPGAGALRSEATNTSRSRALNVITACSGTVRAGVFTNGFFCSGLARATRRAVVELPFPVDSSVFLKATTNSTYFSRASFRRSCRIALGSGDVPI